MGIEEGADASCFFCSKLEKKDNDDAKSPKLLPISNLLKHLNIVDGREKFSRKRTRHDVAESGSDLGDGGNISVPFCTNCEQLAEKFSELYNQRQLIDLEMNRILGVIQDLIGNPESKGDTKSEKLRKEIYRSCLLRGPTSAKKMKLDSTTTKKPGSSSKKGGAIGTPSGEILSSSLVEVDLNGGSSSDSSGSSESEEDSSGNDSDSDFDMPEQLACEDEADNLKPNSTSEGSNLNNQDNSKGYRDQGNDDSIKLVTPEKATKSFKGIDCCGKTFYSKWSYSEHQQASHGIPIKYFQILKLHSFINKDTGKATCILCGLEVETFKHFQCHYKRAHLELPHRCNRCDENVAKAESSLPSQPSTSEGEPKTSTLVSPRKSPGKSKICDICDKAFSRLEHLRRHRDTVHLKLRKFDCDHCDKKFMTEKDRKKHVESIHIGIRYDCEECGKSYSSKYKLTAHMKLEH